MVGKGSFVAPKNIEVIKEQHLREIEDKLREALALAHLSGIEIKELKEMFDILAEE